VTLGLTCLKFCQSSRPPCDLHTGDCPFFVVWNTETQRCRTKFGIDVNPGRYGILENTVGDGWNRGDVINLIYRPGSTWPQILDNGTVLYGGVPQAGNITEHLMAAKHEIEMFVPDPNFSGYGVLDFEKWRPLFATNWGPKLDRNRQYSRKLVRDRHPDWPKARVEAAATQEFEVAARLYLEETLKLAKQLRPNALWGYYIYPECFHNTTSGTCKDLVSFQWNKKLEWLAEASTAIYPSMYYGRTTDPTQTRAITYGNMDASVRWRMGIGRSHLPTIVYSKLSIDTDNGTQEPFYTLSNLEDSIGFAADLGAHGVILWGNHNSERTREHCERVKSFLDTTLGPYVERVLEHMRVCSYAICSSRGRCVLSDPRSGLTLESLRPFDDYSCSCYPGYSGSNCQNNQ